MNNPVNTRIDYDTLRAAFNLAVNAIEDLSPGGIELQHDYYWGVYDDKARYDLVPPPAKAIGCGQLVDDWAILRSIAAGERDPLGLGLRSLAAILEYCDAHGV